MSFKITVKKPVAGEIWEEFTEVLEYWQKVKMNQPMPRWHFSSFDIAEINPRLVPYVAVFDVLELDFRIRYFGTERVWLQKKDYTNCLLSEYQPEMIALKIKEELQIVLKNQEPIKVTTERSDIDSKEVLTYEFLYLPLSKNGKDVDMVFTLGLDDRSLRELHQDYDRERRIGLIGSIFTL